MGVDINTVIAVLGFASGSLVSYGAAVARITKMQETVRKLETRDCPCADVKAMQRRMAQYDEYFANDSRALKLLDKEVEVLKSKMDGVNDKLDEISGDVKLILRKGVYME